MMTALTCGLPPNQNILSCFLIKHKKYQSCSSRHVLKSLLSPYWLVAFTPLSSKMVPGNFAPQEFRAAPKVYYECQFIRILKAKLMAFWMSFVSTLACGPKLQGVTSFEPTLVSRGDNPHSHWNISMRNHRK